MIHEGKLSAKGFKFAIVVSRFNSFISDRLVDGALDALKRHGAEDKQVDIYKVPGAYEIPLVAKLVAKKKMWMLLSVLVLLLRVQLLIFTMWHPKLRRALHLPHLIMRNQLPLE